MLEKFDRISPIMPRSFALRKLNRYETEINKHFWSYKVIADRAKFLSRTKKKQDTNFSTAKVFDASGPDSLKIPLSVSTRRL